MAKKEREEVAYFELRIENRECNGFAKKKRRTFLTKEFPQSKESPRFNLLAQTVVARWVETMHITCRGVSFGTWMCIAYDALKKK